MISSQKTNSNDKAIARRPAPIKMSGVHSLLLLHGDDKRRTTDRTDMAMTQRTTNRTDKVLTKLKTNAATYK
jgi:hypothetical protein